MSPACVSASGARHVPGSWPGRSGRKPKFEGARMHTFGRAGLAETGKSFALESFLSSLIQGEILRLTGSRGLPYCGVFG